MSRILITGGSGFLGQNLIRQLSRRGYETLCLDRYEADFLAECGTVFLQGDISEEKQLIGFLEGVDVVIHLACTILPQMSNSDPYFDMVSNVGGTLHLLDAAVRNHVGKIIFFSSGGTVYGVPESVPIREDHPTNPTCSYGISKLMIEKYLRLYRSMYGLQGCSVRLANPYGPCQRVKSAQGVIPVFCYKALTRQPIEIWGDGSVKRDFIYVDDAVDAVVKLIEFEGEMPYELNIGSGEAVSLRKLLEVIAQVVGEPLDCRYAAGRAFDVPINVLDTTRARELLNWKVRIPLEEGLRATVEYIRKKFM